MITIEKVACYDKNWNLLCIISNKKMFDDGNDNGDVEEG